MKASKSHRRFSGFAIGGLAAVATLVAFGDQDRRSLLIFEAPEAFALSEAIDNDLATISGEQAFSSVRGYRASPGRLSRLPERVGAARNIPARATPLGSVGGSGEEQQASSVGGLPAAVGSAAQPAAAQLASNDPIIAVGPGNGPALGPFVPGPLISGPIGAIVVPGTTSGGTPPGTTSGGTPPGASSGGTTSGGTTDPVVPAVPEPASWLLMILGVGWLGRALRRSTRRHTALS